MMTETIKRLQEIEILFNQMKLSSEDHSTFRANLNAFIQLARSITWVMQKEFSRIPEFKEWYKSIKQEMKNDEIFEFFKNLRNTSVKEKSLGSNIRITTTFDGSFNGQGEYITPIGRVDERGNLVIDNVSKITIDGKPTDEIKQYTTLQYFFDEKPEDDAFELCSLYMKKLRNMVVECHNKFSTY